MDSLHSSPISSRLEARDYESSIECYSVCEDREDLNWTETKPTCEASDSCGHNMDNNYTDKVNLNNDNNLITNANVMPNKCRVCDQIFDDKFFNDKKLINSTDIESNESNRKKSLIKRLYSRQCEKRVQTKYRLSILGRPIPLHRYHNDVAFYREKIGVYNFLQRPRGMVAFSYHIFVSFVVFICLLLTIFSTISDYENYAINGIKYMDILIAVLFSSEFLARFWSSSCISHYQGISGKFRFLRNPFRIIDIFVIITSCIVLFFDTKRHTLFIYFRGFRFLQVFQMLRLEHRFRPWRLMASVVWAQREHLAITTYMGFLSLLFISFAIYFVEKDINPAFNSIAASMWWGVITLCTVGYGDMSPVTPIGKFLSCFCIIIGVSIFALPAGILGTGLALKVQEQQRNRQMGKRREPAAKLIQWTWRCYAAGETSTSTVTWKMHIRSHSLLPEDQWHKALTDQEKTAIRFLRVVKYFISRRHFNRALKPYDIKDVLEQYASGHADVLGRVKHMQSKLNTIQTSVNNNLKTLNESKDGLNSRMDQMEWISIDMKNKIQELVTNQSKDKSIIETLVSVLNKQFSCDSKNVLSLPSRQTTIRKRRNSF